LPIERFAYSTFGYPALFIQLYIAHVRLSKIGNSTDVDS
jgi:hypothetical protein